MFGEPITSEPIALSMIWLDGSEKMPDLRIETIYGYGYRMVKQ